MTTLSLSYLINCLKAVALWRQVESSPLSGPEPVNNTNLLFLCVVGSRAQPQGPSLPLLAGRVLAGGLAALSPFSTLMQRDTSSHGTTCDDAN